MQCPEHPDVKLRREAGFVSGFCARCLKHYPLCMSVLHMEICEKLRDHEGLHRSNRGTEWEEAPPTLWERLDASE